MSSNFYRSWTDIRAGSTLPHLCALAENALCDPHSPVSCCSQVQLLIKANFRDVRLMCPRVPTEISSARRLWAALREACLPTDCKGSWEAEQHQLLQILLPPPPSSPISMLQRKRLLSLNSQKGTLKEATCTSQSKHQPGKAGKAHQLAAAPLHQALL